MARYIINPVLIIISIIVFIISADANEPGTYLINRRILALYDSAEEKNPKKTLIHENAEVILNHLGYIVDYADVRSGLPDSSEMRNYRAVITWFQDNILNEPEKYCMWLINQIKHGKKIIILDQFGAFEDELRTPVDNGLIESVFAEFGVQYMGNETENPLLIETVFKDEKMVEFERKLYMETNYFAQVRQIDPSLKVYLKLKRIDIPDSDSCAVFSSKAGAMALPGYARYYNETNYKKQWRINPFLFFGEILREEYPFPVPDTTTYFGRRILFTHIDGDAFISGSQIDSTKLCGEIIIDRIFKKYVIPTSASIIAGEIITGSELPWIKGRKDLNSIVRSMYEIPYIEPVSHGYTHPLDWSRNITAIIIPPYSDKIDASNYDVLEESAYESLSMNMGYINVSESEMIYKEVVESIKYINTNFLTGNGKKANMIFWTGNCSPPASALELCRKNNIKNINGGDSIFDSENNSYIYLSPIGKSSSAGIQFYTGACNENIYTNLWSGPYYGYKNVIETFQRTESPVRIKPANIYYHFYSGERLASLSALEQVYDFTQSNGYFPIYTSKYIDIAGDWFETQIYCAGENKYLIKNKGYLRTVRFDNCHLYPDLRNSKGVIGFIHYQGSLYISLDGCGENEIQLTDTPPDSIYLRESTCELNNISISKGNIECFVSGFGKAVFIFSNLTSNSKYAVEFNNSLHKTETDSKGVLKFQLPEEPAVKDGMLLKIYLIEQDI